MRALDVAGALREVFDPELGLDVVSLGLVYGIEATADSATVTMTMTSPACPMGSLILESAETVLRHHFPGASITVLASWDPPWDADMADDLARGRLGLPPRPVTQAGGGPSGHG